MDGDLRRVVSQVAQRVFFGHALERATQLAFYAVLALAPFLVVLTSLAGFLPSQDTVQWLLERARELMPQEAYALVSQVMKDVVGSRSATLFTLGIVTALWSASRAADALRAALNSAWALKDGRSYVRRQLLAMGFTIGGAVLLLAAVVASVVGAGVVEHLAHFFGLDEARSVQAWRLLRWPIAVGCLVVLAALAYRVLPDTRPRPLPTWVGALVATGLFLASARLFSLYTERFATYGPTYGALAGGVVLLLWSWLSAIAFIVGGEVTAAFPGSRPRRLS